MPKVRRERIPEALMRHLVLRIREREIPYEQLIEFNDWLETDPEVPDGKWYKAFSGMTVCGEGELVRTFLRIGQAPDGKKVE